MRGGVVVSERWVVVSEMGEGNRGASRKLKRELSTRACGWGGTGRTARDVTKPNAVAHYSNGVIDTFMCTATKRFKKSCGGLFSPQSVHENLAQQAQSSTNQFRAFFFSCRCRDIVSHSNTKEKTPR